MLLAAAILTVFVGLMHSVLGGRQLIAPIIRMDNLPIILGRLENTQLTLRIGWHALSLTWWAMSAVLFWMHFTKADPYLPLLGAISVLFFILGMIALVASRGRHLSWVMFLPTSVLTGIVFAQGL